MFIIKSQTGCQNSFCLYAFSFTIMLNTATVLWETAITRNWFVYDFQLQEEAVSLCTKTNFSHAKCFMYRYCYKCMAMHKSYDVHTVSTIKTLKSISVLMCGFMYWKVLRLIKTNLLYLPRLYGGGGGGGGVIASMQRDYSCEHIHTSTFTKHAYTYMYTYFAYLLVHTHTHTHLRTF